MTASIALIHCLDCHHVVHVPITDVSLITSRGVTTYGFACPRCHVHSIRVASSHALAAFARGGIRPRLIPLDPPLIAGQPPTGPAIDEDDLIAFGRELHPRTPQPAK